MLICFSMDKWALRGHFYSYVDPVWSLYNIGPCNYTGCICKTRENSNFLKNGKMVISDKIQNFSRSWMMKRTSPLELSREI